MVNHEFGDQESPGGDLGRSRRGGVGTNCNFGSGIVHRAGSEGIARAGGGKGVLLMSGGVRRLTWRFVASSRWKSRADRTHFMTTQPVLESLESRQLLTLYTGFSHIRNIPTSTGVYSLQIDGPGVLKTDPAGGGAFNVKVLGTTDGFHLDDHPGAALGFM